MQVDFFGTQQDIRDVWHWILEIPGMMLIEEYSRPDKANRIFSSFDDVIPHEDNSIAAWPSTVGGKPRTQRIVFEPNTARQLKAKGRTMLYSPALITMLENNDQKGCLANASLMWWSEAGAKQRSTLPDEFLDEVDWKSFASIARKIQRKIASESVAKLRSAAILPDAMHRLQAGEIKLWGWGEEVGTTSPLLQPIRR